MRLLCCLPFLVGTMLLGETPNQLTLLLQFEGQPSSTSLLALRSELKHILAESRVSYRLDFRLKPIAGSVPGELVVFKMKGSCSMRDIPVAAVSDERGPLAMTHMVDGEMLPFADVECDRVRRSVERTVGLDNSQLHDMQFGVALARVMAHELYHMLAHSTLHDQAGVSKRSLSSRELTTGRLLLSPPATAALAHNPDDNR